MEFCQSEKVGTLVFAFAFLPQHFGKVVGTYEYFVSM